MDPKYKRFTIQNPDRIEFLAQLYFECEVKKVPRSEIAEKLNIPSTTISSHFSNHINKLSHDITDERYSMFYNKVKQISEMENHAIDLIPPTITTTTVVIKEPVITEANASLLIQRKNLSEQIIQLNENISLQADFILEAMSIGITKFHEQFTELVDTLTVKQYRIRDYPEHFKCKMKVIEKRVNEIKEQLELFTKDDLQTDTSNIRIAEVMEDLNTIKGNIDRLELENPKDS